MKKVPWTVEKHKYSVAFGWNGQDKIIDTRKSLACLYTKDKLKKEIKDAMSFTATLRTSCNQPNERDK